jgi:ubiquinone/menaquinone biosynthesis C-methylase UbiE
MKFFNNIVYELFPNVYNALDQLTFGAWWNLIRQALKYVPPEKKVLEVGFGPGRLHVELAREAELCSGVDLAWGMCRFTKRRLHKEGLRSLLVRGDVLALPYATDTFTVVVSTFAFSGFPEGERAMGEMARVTAKGGCIVLVDIGLPADNNRLGIFLARLWEHLGDHLYDQPSLMSETGLEVIEFKEIGPGKHIHVTVGQKHAR